MIERIKQSDIIGNDNFNIVISWFAGQTALLHLSDIYHFKKVGLHSSFMWVLILPDPSTARSIFLSKLLVFRIHSHRIGYFFAIHSLP